MAALRPEALHVFFGSETGTSRAAALRVASEARRAGWEAPATAVAPLDAVPLAQLATHARAAVFVVSTHGQGEAPANMSAFWSFLRRADLPADSLANLSYAVFGLGDSGYALYNAAARRLDARLAQLGARRLCVAGLGDARHKSGGHEAAFDRWLPTLWRALQASAALPPRAGKGAAFPAPQDAIDAAKGTPDALAIRASAVGARASAAADACDARTDGGLRALARAHGIALVASGATAAAHAATSVLAPAEAALERSRGAAALVRVEACARATADDQRVKDVRALRLRMPPGVEWRAGDALEVYPEPPPGTAEELLRRCGVPADGAVRIQANDADGCGVSAKSPRDAVCVRALELVSAFLDIAGATPSRACLAALAESCADESERARLAHFASREGADDLQLYARSDDRTLMEVLDDFPSASPQLAAMLEHAPRLRPRPMSVANAFDPGTARPGEGALLELIVAPAEWQTPRGRARVGLCTRYLRRLQAGAQARVRLRAGDMRPPADPRAPLVLVGPGTGVAPLRAMLLERAAARRAGVPVGRVALFVGCRHKGLDDLYAAEWEALSRDGDISLLAWAYSRDEPDADAQGARAEGAETAPARPMGGTPAPKYVQHALRAHASEVRALAAEGAHFYVVGAAERMPDDVQAALDAVVGKGFVARAQAEGRYHVEAWS